MVPSQFRRLIDALRGHFGAIQESIDKQERAIRDTSEATNEQQREIPRVIASAIHTASEKDIPAYEKSQRNKEYRQQERLIWVTFFAFLAAAVYAAIAAKQLVEMRKATEAAKRSSDIAACALRQSQEQFKDTLTQMQAQTKAQVDSAKAGREAVQVAQKEMAISERPLIKVVNMTRAAALPWNIDLTKDMTPIINGQILIEIENLGKSPARIIKIEAHFWNSTGDVQSIHKMCIDRTQQSNYAYALTVFPEAKPVGITRPLSDDISKGNMVVEPSGPNTFPIPYSLVGCIQYKSFFSNEVFYTGMLYDILSPDVSHVAIDKSSGYISVFPNRSYSVHNAIKIDHIALVPEDRITADIK